MTLHKLTFNPYEVNTYILEGADKQAIIVDPACAAPEEKDALLEYLSQHQLKPFLLLNTHGHFDHLVGNAFVSEKFNIPTAAHPDDIFLFEDGYQKASTFGYPAQKPPLPTILLADNQQITERGFNLQLLHVPGHSPGSVAVYAPDEQLLLTGDILFAGSIGRTDLPRGDFDTLIAGIEKKILSLPKETSVYPGHGPSTTIEDELHFNPFLQYFLKLS